MQSQNLNNIATHAVNGDETSDSIYRRKRCFGPLAQHESSAVFGEYRFNLLIACEFICISFLDAFVNVTDLPGFILHILAQRIDSQKALGPSGSLWPTLQSACKAPLAGVR